MWKQVKFSYYMFPDAQHMGVVTELVFGTDAFGLLLKLHQKAGWP